MHNKSFWFWYFADSQAIKRTNFITFGDDNIAETSNLILESSSKSLDCTDSCIFQAFSDFNPSTSIVAVYNYGTTVGSGLEFF